MRTLATLIPFALGITVAAAQGLTIDSQPYIAEHFTMDDGLPTQRTHGIVQDRFGFLWIATNNGLVRYDGRSFETFNPEPDDPHSLGGRWVYHVDEDSTGNLWVATAGSLNLVDRAAGHFVRYPHHPESPDSAYGIGGDLIRWTGPAYGGERWIAYLGGLDRLNPATGIVARYRQDPDDPQGFPFIIMRTALFVDRAGTLWIGGARAVYRYRRASDTFERYPLPVDDELDLACDVTRLYEAPSEPGILWIGTDADEPPCRGGGLVRLDTDSGTFAHYAHSPEDQRSLPDPFVTSFLEDGRGDLWIGTKGGLARLERETGAFTRFRPDPDQPSGARNKIRSIIEDADGSLIVGVEHTSDAPDELAGIVLFTPGTGAFTPLSFPLRTQSSGEGPSIAYFHKDRTGVIWVGTTNDGLLKLNRSYFRYYRPSGWKTDGRGDDRVADVIVDREGMLWLAMSGSGLVHFDPSRETSVRYRHDPHDTRSLASDNLRTVFQDEAGTIWVGTEGSILDRLEPERNAFTHYRVDAVNPPLYGGANIKAIYEDARGALWVGTLGAGLYRLDRDSGIFTRFHVDPAQEPGGLNWIQELWEDRDGALWAGTLGGLGRFDRDAGRFTPYADETHFTYINAIYEDWKGRLWLGTSHGGLYLFDREQNSYHPYFTERDGLPIDHVCAILEDDAGWLWISTLRGLARFNPDMRTSRTYDLSDGLQSNVFWRGSAAKGPDGRLYFGGERGLYVVDPTHLADESHAPPVVLTTMLIGGERRLGGVLQRPLSGDVRLRHDDNDLSFEFVALHFANSNKNKYAYRLEPYDDDWHDADGSPTARYTNLDAGNYVFRVKAANADGVWNEEGAVIRLVILPPWWRTWWFRAFMGAILVGIVAHGHRVRLRHQLAIEHTRTRIADDLHDDVGSRMSSIALMLEHGTQRQRLGDDERAYLQLAAKEIRQVVSDLRDTVWVIDSSHDGLADLVVRMEQVAGQLLRSISHRIAVPRHLPAITLSMERRRNVLMTFKEALHNAARHADAESIGIDIRVDDSTFSFQVRDDGRGFEEGSVRPGYGMKTMRRRTDEIGGRLYVESAPGLGTRISLEVDLT